METRQEQAELGRSCIHGRPIGTPGGFDILCHLCEMGLDLWVDNYLLQWWLGEYAFDGTEWVKVRMNRANTPQPSTFGLMDEINRQDPRGHILMVGMRKTAGWAPTSCEGCGYRWSAAEVNDHRCE